MRIFGILRTLKDIEPVNFYRTFAPLRAIAQNGGHDVVFMDRFLAQRAIDGDFTGPSTAGFDIYQSCRLYNEDNKDFLDLVHQEGGVFVFDADDDLTNAYRLVNTRPDDFIQVLEEADYVTTSTPELAKHFSQWTQKPPIVLPNHMDVKGFGDRADQARRLYADLAIGFSGTKTHWGDWYTPSVPWARICENLGTLPLLHGDPPNYLLFARPEVRAKCGYKDYPAILAQFDILICSVDITDEFSIGKSGVKALEAMVAGAVPICSRLPAYVRLYEEGAPIVLIEEDTRDCWYETMRALVEDRGRRRHLASLGRLWVTEHRNITAGYQLWLDAYEKMIAK